MTTNSEPPKRQKMIPTQSHAMLTSEGIERGPKRAVALSEGE